ncbi:MULTISPECIES: hypothetical protein [Siminovitchia]|uniref:hypothetical protein n=1 Tax=Siminovitchia TaxID=2837510 RepID=UPI0022A6F8F3|nr:hypothetical protein [Siminovitchia thermophila]
MSRIIDAFSQIKGPKVWPVHPRTKKKLHYFGLDINKIPDLHIIEPVGYLDMLKLENLELKIVTFRRGSKRSIFHGSSLCYFA